MSAPDERQDVLRGAISEELGVFDSLLNGEAASLRVHEVGTILSVGNAIAKIKGLPDVMSEEIIRFPGDRLGVAFNLDADETDVYLLDETEGVKAGDEVRRTKRVMDIPVGEELLGRIIDPMGRPLDEAKAIPQAERRAIESEAPGIMEREPVNVPLQTGLQVIDSVIPIGRGQRELILGDRQTGKTAIALDTIINQADKNVICIYCAIGQSNSTVAKVVMDLEEHGAMDYTIVIVATGDDTPGLNYIAPYSATTIGEYFMEKGRDVLVVYDDLTKHARSYRELSLLLRRPPAREAYPGDIFYIHSRLLERSTRLRKENGGGSLTALPIIETQAENMSAYIPTNLISITDGQIYLSPKLYHEGILPAVDIGKSVSRVGGKTQLPAFRAVAGDLKLSHSQYEELETFARFGVQLDEDTRKTLERGRRVREVLKQDQYQPIPVPEQIAVLLSVTSGLLDEVPIHKISRAKKLVREAARGNLGDTAKRILDGEKLEDEDKKKILDVAKEALDADSELKETDKKPGEEAPEGETADEKLDSAADKKPEQKKSDNGGKKDGRK